MTSGSIVIRRSLGRRLKALRLHAGKSAADVTAAGIASKAKLARIESGANSIRMADVRALCWLYGADHQTTDTLAELALNTTRDGFWEDFGDVMPSWFALYVELEAAASRMFVYDPELVPGVLQTGDYQRAIFETAPDLTPESADQQIRLRTQRQRAAFDRTPALHVTAVLSEGVLARQVGGQDVTNAQTRHLLDFSREPHLDVLVLPWYTGAHVAMKGSFVILGFDSPEDPDVVYLETYAGGRYIETPKVVDDYHRMFATIGGQSIPLKEHVR